MRSNPYSDAEARRILAELVRELSTTRGQAVEDHGVGWVALGELARAWFVRTGFDLPMNELHAHADDLTTRGAIEQVYGTVYVGSVALGGCCWVRLTAAAAEDRPHG